MRDTTSAKIAELERQIEELRLQRARLRDILRLLSEDEEREYSDHEIERNWYPELIHGDMTTP